MAKTERASIIEVEVEFAEVVMGWVAIRVNNTVALGAPPQGGERITVPAYARAEFHRPEILQRIEALGLVEEFMSELSMITEANIGRYTGLFVLMQATPRQLCEAAIAAVKEKANDAT